MGVLYKQLIRPVFFRVDPERIHNFALRISSAAGNSGVIKKIAKSRWVYQHPGLKQTIAGIEFENPLGLAAGFDKNGHAIEMLGTFGFGHLEIGSVSAFPSDGNPKPRLFRSPKDKAIIVSYGVPNEGADAVALQLSEKKPDVPLGINLVKTNDPSRPATDEEVFSDYSRSFEILQPHASYMNLNMSCPNSASDRDFFDDPAKIHQLLDRLSACNPIVPVFMKLKPVSDEGILREIVHIADDYPFISGFGINLPAGKPPELNFTSGREELSKYPGAVGGRPVEELINNNLRMLYKIIGPDSRYSLVAAGGIFTAEDAYKKIRLGASLVQLYTAMVYEGPGIVKKILKGLAKLMEKDGYSNISEAVGREGE
jgi:dihydroorotate dehydrogenase